jgi:site-specific recombinase XerD
MTMDEFKSYAKDYLEGEPYRSKNTYDQRRIGIEKFIRFMEAEGREEVDVKSILAYRRSLVGYAPNTFSQYMRRLRSFFSWMVDAELIDKNPISSKMVNTEQYRKVKKILSKDDFENIFTQERPTRVHKSTFIRNRALTLFALTSGMRESEVLSVTPNDLDWERNHVLVRNGKGGKSRSVLFSPLAQSPVRDYITKCRPQEAEDDMPIFLQTINGEIKPLSRLTAYHGIKSYIEMSTGRDDLTPHSLRHSFASLMVSNGMSIKELQTILGHSSLETTAIYAQLLVPDEKPVESADQIFDSVMKKVKEEKKEKAKALSKKRNTRKKNTGKRE